MVDGIRAAEDLLGLVGRFGLARDEDPLAQTTALEFCFRAAFLLAFERLRAVREEYPATQQTLMADPDPAIVGVRDALTDVSDFISGRDLIDLLSATELPCIAPRLHRGWQDRTRSCQEARRVSLGAIGFALDAEERERLLDGLGICQRVLRVPPPFDLLGSEGQAVFGPLLGWIARLAPEGERETVRGLVGKIL